MKIAELTSLVLKSYEYPSGGWVLVRARTEEGVEGIGECFVPDQTGRGAFAARHLIEHSLRQGVIGEEALDIERIWEKIYRVCSGLYDRRGLAIHALSGVDMALFDAAGKTLGIPVHRLLGGCFRERVRVYVSSIWMDPQDPRPALQDTDHYLKEGFTAIKYYGWAGFGSDKQRATRLLGELRHAAGEGVELMLDLGRPQGLAEALDLARMIEDSGAGIYWWEEPLSSSDDLENLARLNSRTRLRIAAGEAELTAFAFRDLILKEAVGVLQPDLSWAGGLTEGRRIAQLARLFNVPLVPHNWGTAINFAASIHLVAAMERGFLCEYPITPRARDRNGPQIPSPMMTELVRNPIRIEQGHALVPQAPGLGIELDEEAVERYTLKE